jgi:A/G-specific adenine glycosylase
LIKSVEDCGTAAAHQLIVDMSFSKQLLAWFELHGRKQLPWQHPRDPYRVWVSEIMLQQTQVATVINYFNRFMKRFPDVKSLAQASPDQVMHHWSGLGYYARARNLHQSAKQLMQSYQGELPDDLELLQGLPGIGRSTAGAIRSLAFGKFAPILDGNVKRVLTRYFAIDGWPGQGKVLKQLWSLSEALTPKQRTADYNQAMMDLGAMVCVRSKPICKDCPLVGRCQAFALGDVARYPASKPKKQRPERNTYLLILRDKEGRILLEQRPPVGVWGGLWSLPECSMEHEVETWCEQELGFQVTRLQHLPPRRHSFSHFHLDITPVVLQMNNPAKGLMDAGPRVWYNLSKPDDRGLAAPVTRILQEIESLVVKTDSSKGEVK